MVWDPKQGFGGLRCPLVSCSNRTRVGYGVVRIAKQPSLRKGGCVSLQASVASIENIDYRCWKNKG